MFKHWEILSSQSPSYLLLSVDHCPMKSSPGHLYIKCTSCNACQRAVCSRELGQCPKQVKYINRQCEKFLQEAQKRVNSQVSSFEDDSGLTQTFNQAAREYVTVLTNGVWMNFVKWQTKLIQRFLINNIHKSCVPFVTKGLLQIINRATRSACTCTWTKSEHVQGRKSSSWRCPIFRRRTCT